MLRVVALAIVLANLLFFGFTQGWFDGLLGLRALGDREPARLGAQVRPENIVLMPMASAPAASNDAGGACLEAGPIAAADVAGAEAALKAALPAGGWIDVRSETRTAASTVETHTYRVERADAATAARLAALRLDQGGRSFSPCAKNGAAR